MAQQKNVLKELLDSQGIATALAHEVATFTVPMAPPTTISMAKDERQTKAKFDVHCRCDYYCLRLKTFMLSTQ